MNNPPKVSPRVLAIIDEAIGLQLRRRYRDRPEVYRDLLTIAVIAKAWRITHPRVSEVGITDPGEGSSELLTTRQAAEVAGLKQNSIGYLIRTGRLPADKRGGRLYLIRADDLAAYLIRRETPGC